MNDYSSKTLELFTGIESLNRSIKEVYTSIGLDNMVYQSIGLTLKESLNAIYSDYNIKGLAESAREAVKFTLSPELSEMARGISDMLKTIDLSIPELIEASRLDIPVWGYPYDVLHIYDENTPEEEQVKEAEVSEKILSEILLPESEKIITLDSPIITVAPINDEVLRYLKENPEEWFKLTGGQFEMVMQEIYSRLGYQVERTKATRDGGKDLIIRKNEPVGDLIYYVECKKYAPNRPIGVGIVREFKCTIDTDSVNGGIIATTSHFAKGASDFILNNNFDCKVKMHDGAVIKRLLNQVC